ncbi:MAG: phage portal protein [Kiritimatiellae bacterium]|nr:phage portal protein [Kiritimatiellia bacterium]
MLDFLKRKEPRKAIRLSLPMWMKARFDAAQTTKDNARHWGAAEFLSADAEADPSVRKTLRTRARYEVQNNSYARGIVKTLADDTVGTGPRLQMLLESDETNNRIEHDFAVWAQRIRLASKLRTIRMARCQDGEAFAVLAQNPRLSTDVKLDLQLVEADRVTDDEMKTDGSSVDGITFDQFGNPKSYRVLKKHPGGTDSFNMEAYTVKAENMIHVFRQDRPEQHRGIPEITAALPLFAHLRRFTLAVVSAAEAAADFAGILYTDAPASGEADAVEAMDTIQLERNMLLTMPGGWKMSQVDPKQPVTTYGEFKREILNEIARCLSMPYNIAAGNSSGYNYASGRLDHQTYYKALKVDRSFMETEILDRVFDLWLKEWSLATRTTIDPCDCRHVWFWDGQEHVDPGKEATAQQIRLDARTTTLAAEYAKQGKDWETELRQIARERKLMKELGIESEETRKDSDNENEEKDGNE